MTAVLNGAACEIVGLVDGGEEQAGESRRWPDKSTAVGWGACGWFCCVFSAARNLHKAAASQKTSSKQPENPPSHIWRTLFKAWP